MVFDNFLDGFPLVLILTAEGRDLVFLHLNAAPDDDAELFELLDFHIVTEGRESIGIQKQQVAEEDRLAEAAVEVDQPRFRAAGIGKLLLERLIVFVELDKAHLEKRQAEDFVLAGGVTEDVIRQQLAARVWPMVSSTAPSCSAWLSRNHWGGSPGCLTMRTWALPSRPLVFKASCGRIRYSISKPSGVAVSLRKPPGLASSSKRKLSGRFSR
ncbi:MAG: hypothetical protein BWY77_01986 [bacterium ADurb.Bin431]|nr:MAG: hypothetical protein BWY77_01986 [bacterium ADurb.Bin431]